MTFYGCCCRFIDDIHLPLAVFLMLDKEKNTYKDLWIKLRMVCWTKGLTFRPRKMRLDLIEPVSRAAFVEVFPQCTVWVCRHQLLETWRTRLQNIMSGDRIHAQFTERGNVTRQWLSAFFGLPFLPADQVQDAFNELIALTPENAEPVVKFLVYLLKTFVNPNALYPATDWAAGPTVSYKYDSADIYQEYFSTLILNPEQPANVLLNCVIEWQVLMTNGLQIIQRREGLQAFEGLLSNQELELQESVTNDWKLYAEGRISRLKYLDLIGHNVSQIS